MCNCFTARRYWATDMGAKQPVNTNLGTEAAHQEGPYSAIPADARLGRAKTVFKLMLESSGRR
jgi:hypothetical protein